MSDHQLAATWGWLIDTVPGGEKGLWMCTALIHTVTFFLCNGLLTYFRRNGYFRSYLIQPRKSPSDQLVRRAFMDVLTKHFVAGPIMFWAMWYVAEACGVQSSVATLPSLWEVTWQLFVMIMVQDTLFYWSHRLLHCEFLYPHIHKQHHQFYTPIGISAEYAHPVEDLANAIAFIAGPLILGCHIFTLWLWMFLRTLETIDAHSGYSFPLSPFTLFQIADHHDYHHSQNKGCYGSFFGFWDWIMGTDAEYKKWKAAKKERAAKEKEAEKANKRKWQ